MQIQYPIKPAVEGISVTSVNTKLHWHMTLQHTRALHELQLHVERLEAELTKARATKAARKNKEAE